MTEDEIIAACEHSSVPAPIRAVATEAAAHIRGCAEMRGREESSDTLPVSHYRDIYRHRLAHCRRIGLVKIGLVETVAAFEELDDELPLKLVLVYGPERDFALWISPACAVVGCIVHERTDVPDQTRD